MDCSILPTEENISELIENSVTRRCKLGLSQSHHHPSFSDGEQSKSDFDPTTGSIDGSLNPRLRRKRAVKIKRTRTDGSYGSTASRRCRSVTDDEKLDSPSDWAKEIFFELKCGDSSQPTKQEPELFGSYLNVDECRTKSQHGRSLIDLRDSDGFVPDSPTANRNVDKKLSLNDEKNKYLNGSEEELDRNNSQFIQKSPSKISTKSSLFAKRRSLKEGCISVDGNDKRKLGLSRKASITSKKQTILRKFSLTSEYFTLKFSAEDEGEAIPSPRGLTLGQAINSALERHGMSIDKVDIFLESSNTPLPLASDCFLLANSVLWIRAKEEDKSKDTSPGRSNVTHTNSSSLSLGHASTTTHDRKSVTLNVKSKKISVPSEENLCDISPSGTLTHGDAQKFRGSNRSRLQSIFNPFVKLQDKQEQLAELLNIYSNEGLPKMPDLLTLGRPQYDSSVFHLENHWTEIVDNHELLNKRQRDQQEAVWELLITEVEYIQKLRVIVDLFMCCLFNLQNELLLNEIEADKLFSNVTDVYYATCHFWNVHMSQVLKQSRETREPLNPCLLKAGFLVFSKIFEPYTKYCLEQEVCREYIKCRTKENDLFRTFIMWAEAQSQCNRLKLVDLIVKPFQRLTKYKLLLYAMRKPLDKMETSMTVEEQKCDINSMIEQVEKFVHQVNMTMRQRQDHKQLSQIIERIESYEFVEAPNDECFKLISKFCQFDLLTCPLPGCGPQESRTLLLEGCLKLKDNYSKMDVCCFLLTDMILISKPTTKKGDKVKIIKPPMRLDRILVYSLRDMASFMLVYLNEYHVAQSVYTFHGDSKLWLESIIKAQKDYKEKRGLYLTRSDNVLLDFDDVEDDTNYYDRSPSVEPPKDFFRIDSSPSTDIFLPNLNMQSAPDEYSISTTDVAQLDAESDVDRLNANNLSVCSSDNQNQSTGRHGHNLDRYDNVRDHPLCHNNVSLDRLEGDDESDSSFLMCGRSSSNAGSSTSLLPTADREMGSVDSGDMLSNCDYLDWEGNVKYKQSENEFFKRYVRTNSVETQTSTVHVFNNNNGCTTPTIRISSMMEDNDRLLSTSLPDISDSHLEIDKSKIPRPTSDDYSETLDLSKTQRELINHRRKLSTAYKYRLNRDMLLSNSALEASALTSITPGAAAERAALLKHTKYAAIKATHDFVPVAIETLGPINEGTTFLCEIGDRMKGVSGDPKETAYLFQRVSVIIQRANAIALHGTFVMEEPDD